MSADISILSHPNSARAAIRRPPMDDGRTGRINLAPISPCCGDNKGSKLRPSHFPIASPRPTRRRPSSFGMKMGNPTSCIIPFRIARVWRICTNLLTNGAISHLRLINKRLRNHRAFIMIGPSCFAHANASNKNGDCEGNVRHFIYRTISTFQYRGIESLLALSAISRTLSAGTP